MFRTILKILLSHEIYTIIHCFLWSGGCVEVVVEVICVEVRREGHLLRGVTLHRAGERGEL